VDCPIPFVGAFLTVDGKAVSPRIAARVELLVQLPIFTAVTPLFRVRNFAIHPIKECKSQKGDHFQVALQVFLEVAATYLILCFTKLSEH
jgi:hypothetical protein